MPEFSRYTQSSTVLPGVCDHTAKLGYVDAFTVCQDLATTHAQALGVGAWDMAARGLFWLTVKTRLHFYDRPRMMDVVTLETCPVKPEQLRGLRDYRISQGGKTLISGMTEWAVLETATGKLHRMGDVFPPEVVPAEAAADQRPFLRINPDFSDGQLLGVHRVGSNDIDLGHHMNNVAYLRALFGLFSTKELDEMRICEIELSFRSSCYEGDELRYYTRQVADGLEFAAFTEAPKPMLLGKLTVE